MSTAQVIVLAVWGGLGLIFLLTVLVGMFEEMEEDDDDE